MPKRTSSKSTTSSKFWNGAHWIGKDFDDEKTRHRFIGALRRRRSPDCSLFTPFWASSFIDWLIYEGTIIPCGLRVESIDPDNVQFEANCSGVQSEGICLDATFVVPTAEFTRDELKQMVHDFEFSPSDNARMGELFTGERITELEWWYDGCYDERGQDGEDE